MIYLLYGDNFTQARAKLREIIESQLKRNPDASYFKLNDETWDEGKLEEFIGGQGLFQNKYIVVLDGLLEEEDSEKVVLGKIKEIETSANIFIIIEKNLTKDIVGKIEKRAEKVQKFESSKKIVSEKKEFNVFTLTDALGARDKKKLWVLYEKGVLSGVDPEEMHRLFFWQVKAMLGAASSESAMSAGLNPFVHKKSLGFAKNFKKDELVNLSRKLITLYHEARRGAVDFDVALERWVLEI
jgi:DNA polymerase III delta subunit